MNDPIMQKAIDKNSRKIDPTIPNKTSLAYKYGLYNNPGTNSQLDFSRQIKQLRVK